MATRLTDKQQLFVNFYVACLNATEAARQAGYQHPRQMGAENLSKPVIREAIDELLKQRTIDASEVLARLSAHATCDMSDFFDVNEYTGQPVFNLQKAKEAGKLHLIKKMNFNKSGFLESIELHDPQAALVHLGRAYSLFVERRELTGKDGGAIQIEDATDYKSDLQRKLNSIIAPARDTEISNNIIQ